MIQTFHVADVYCQARSGKGLSRKATLMTTNVIAMLVSVVMENVIIVITSLFLQIYTA